MKETLKRIKADVILSALLCVVLGVVLIIWSDETISAICMLLAFGLIVMGVVNLVGYFTNHRLLVNSDFTRHSAFSTGKRKRWRSCRSQILPM